MAFKDPEQRKLYQAQYYQNRKAGIAIKQKEPFTHAQKLEREQRWRDKTRVERRAYAVQWRKKNAIRIRIINALGGKCVRCGYEDKRALQIDHINGGGVKERTGFKNGYQYEKYVLEHLDREKYQILCANCNWIKRDEEQESMWKYK